MGKEPTKLPQSLLDAAKRGTEIAKNAQSPSMKARRERIEMLNKRFAASMKDPESRARFIRLADTYARDFAERQLTMSKLGPEPQRYEVLADLTHKTNERYVEGRHVLHTERLEVKYATGCILNLQAKFLLLETRGRIQSLWVWVNDDGWIIRPGVLDNYILKARLRKQ